MNQKDQLLSELTQSQQALIDRAREGLPPILFDEWIQRTKERIGEVDRQRRGVRFTKFVTHCVWQRLHSIASWTPYEDRDDPNLRPPPRLPPALEKLVYSLPLQVFGGACCPRTEHLIDGVPDDPNFAPSFEAFDYGSIQDSIRELEKRRLVCRYAKKSGQVCFLVFGRSVSSEFIQEVKVHVAPEIIYLPLALPTSLSLKANAIESAD